MRNRLFDTSEYFGYSLERRIESMGRSITDMCLHLLGGTQRLLMKNRHQYPTIVVLACSNDLSGAYAICAARILATKNVRIYLYLPPEHRIEQSSIENELKLFRTSQSTLTDQVDGSIEMNKRFSVTFVRCRSRSFAGRSCAQRSRWFLQM